ncbi:two-component response regulator 24-like [Juglans microcarpa x Juglans regia]|uniref:Two-component response regulator 24-like n=2 Tax=Juglans regia TaxID=51240 RepID=A0A2I4G9V3_JUGRE|nr:two-component response regulator 24-like [Juglans regia]XP_041003025.1 two-component response regulator 24-like [Juglans microcarpa x Juglans regia]XP_041003026.1 two-component response regulator 24-like [Juglans microcarpa x Juglans regia]KAF5480980.1 hypothetical protein F2P56_001681 [Juglans regia]
MAPTIESVNQGNGGFEGNNKRSDRFVKATWKNKLTALVVDNGELCRVLERENLRAYGVETVAVETGEAAVELIASGSTFNLIFIDMYLPTMSGPEAVRQIRAMGARSKIIGLTAFITEKDEQDFFAAGIDEFFEKPLDPDWFVPIIREVDNQI